MKYLTTTEARQRLHMSPRKMAQLIRAGTIKTYDDPLDSRKKLIKDTDLVLLAAQSRTPLSYPSRTTAISKVVDSTIKDSN